MLAIVGVRPEDLKPQTGAGTTDAEDKLREEQTCLACGLLSCMNVLSTEKICSQFDVNKIFQHNCSN